MALVNVAYNISFGWDDPNVQSLEAQMLKPLLNSHPVELGLTGRQDAVLSYLGSEPDYPQAFARAFPDSPSRQITFEQIVKAIAAFERTLISGGSAFDRYVFNGEHAALTPAAKRGMNLFFSPRSGCSTCHAGFNFSGNWRDAQGDTGAVSFASNAIETRPMRVPTLRNIALTAPYMHDGRIPTLAAVLDHYARTAERARQPDGAAIDPRLRTFDLNEKERADLLEFLQSLTESAFQAGR
jgi:cytochrome c peroxidase